VSAQNGKDYGVKKPVTPQRRETKGSSKGVGKKKTKKVDVRTSFWLHTLNQMGDQRGVADVIRGEDCFSGRGSGRRRAVRKSKKCAVSKEDPKRRRRKRQFGSIFGILQKGTNGEP